MARSLLYQSVAAALRLELASGEVGPGELLPTESELATAHGVSRVTIRKALGQLKREGLLDSRQGFGWFATAVPLRQSLRGLTTIEAQIAAAGMEAERRVLAFAFVTAPPRVAEVLGAATVLEFSRLNLADGRPFARVTVYVPEQLAESLSRRAVEQRPLHELLTTELGGATQTITAVGASPGDAELLGVLAGSPLLRCERVTTDVAGRPVLVSDQVFNPLVTEFVADLPAAADQEPAGLRLVR